MANTSKLEKSKLSHIDELKKAHGIIHELNSEDGKTCIISDPLSNLKLVKLAMTLLRDNDEIGFTQAIISNCFIEGDLEFKTDQRYASGLLDSLKDLLDAPDPEIVRVGNRYDVTIEKFTLPVRAARREDLNLANKKNPKGRALETEIALLNLICLDKDMLEEIKKETRIYVAFLMATNEVKDKIVVGVKKL